MDRAQVRRQDQCALLLVGGGIGRLLPAGEITVYPGGDLGWPGLQAVAAVEPFQLRDRIAERRIDLADRISAQRDGDDRICILGYKLWTARQVQRTLPRPQEGIRSQPESDANTDTGARIE